MLVEILGRIFTYSFCGMASQMYIEKRRGNLNKPQLFEFIILNGTIE